MPKNVPTVEGLRKRFEADFDTGELFAITKGVRIPVNVGITQGHLRVWVGGVPLYAHRIIWALATGEHPRGVIDHINGCGIDNRLCNLRVVDVTVNNQNRATAQRNNKTSGLLGVCGVSSGSRFRAQIKVNGKKIHLGTFKTANEAHRAYVKAKAEMHRGFVAERFKD